MQAYIRPPLSIRVQHQEDAVKPPNPNGSFQVQRMLRAAEAMGGRELGLESPGGTFPHRF